MGHGFLIRYCLGGAEAERFTHRRKQKASPSSSRHPHLILSESEGCGMCVHADSCMACWYSWSLGRGVGPSGHTPSEGGMLTSDTDG